MISEIVEDNLYFDKFYDNIEEWSFQFEMFFFCYRYKQFEDISDYFLKKGQFVIVDYYIYKNVIFVECILFQYQLEKYKKIYYLLMDDLLKFNFIIYIKVSLFILLYCIEKCGCFFEKKIEISYLEQLIVDYEVVIKQLQEVDFEFIVLIIDGDFKDFVLNKSDFECIVVYVKEFIV